MADYEDLTDKKVTITLTDGTQSEGTVVAGSAIGIIFKPKGTSQTNLIEASALASVKEIVAGPKKLKGRTIPQVTEGKFREHLIERHGLKVSEIQNLTETQAAEYHKGLDHSDLGHKHRELTQAEIAIAEASADAEDDADELESAVI